MGRWKSDSIRRWPSPQCVNGSSQIDALYKSNKYLNQNDHADYLPPQTALAWTLKMIRTPGPDPGRLTTTTKDWNNFSDHLNNLYLSLRPPSIEQSDFSHAWKANPSLVPQEYRVMNELAGCRSGEGLWCPLALRYFAQLSSCRSACYRRTQNIRT